MATFDDVKAVVVEQLSIDADAVKMESKIIEDLGADSLDVVELIMALEEKFEVEITKDGNSFKRKKIFNFMIQYLCPIFAFIIFLSSIANTFGFISM